MPVCLRAQLPADLPLLTGGDSPFDDFGPQRPPSEPATPRLDMDGGLTVIAADGAVAGLLSWHWHVWGPTAGSRCPMIGVWLRAAYRGRGIGRLAQREIAALFFAHTTTNRVEAHTDVDNLAEQRALEAAGFRRDGLIRGAQWRDGAYRDGFLYSILRDDRPSDLAGHPPPASPPAERRL